VPGIVQGNNALAQRIERLMPGVAQPGNYLRQVAFEIPVIQPPGQAGAPVVAGPAVQQAAEEFPIQAFQADLRLFRREVVGVRRQPGEPDQLEPQPRMPLRNAARRGR
jgi:hypothetical protein